MGGRHRGLREEGAAAAAFLSSRRAAALIFFLASRFRFTERVREREREGLLSRFFSRREDDVVVRCALPCASVPRCSMDRFSCEIGRMCALRGYI